MKFEPLSHSYLLNLNHSELLLAWRNWERVVGLPAVRQRSNSGEAYTAELLSRDMVVVNLLFCSHRGLKKRNTGRINTGQFEKGIQLLPIIEGLDLLFL